MKSSADVRRARAPFAAALVAATLAACGTVPRQPADGEASSGAPAAPAKPRGGGYYLDDGPHANPPPNLDAVPDAVPRDEPVIARNSRPYSVFGRTYVPMSHRAPYRQRGIASWYGRKFHGQRTSSGEPYDMYAMTAAHPTLPLPSYARVTNLRNGRSVVVRVNDRGPFLHDRIIDLSYTAAHRLGYINDGSTEVEVEVVLPAASARRGAAGADRGAADESGETGAAGAATVVSSPPSAAAPALPASAAAAASSAPSIETIIARAEAATPDAAAQPGASAGAAPAAAPADAAPARETIWLQLGAFSSEAAALAARVRWEGALGNAAAKPMQIVPEADGFKLQSGPYDQPVDARAAGARIRQALRVQPMLVVR